MPKLKFDDVIKTAYSLDDFNYGEIECNCPQKECLLCHKMFVPLGRNASRQNYCKRTHFINCVVCGKPVKQDPPSIKYGSAKFTCSTECAAEFKSLQTKASMLEKYGVENISQSIEFKEKISEGLKRTSEGRTAKVVATMKERYGGMGSASPQIRAKIEATTQERYGVTNPMESEEFKQKIRNAWATEHTQDKYIATSYERYGVAYPAQNVNIQNKMKQTLFRNWGVEFAGQVPESREKAAATCISRYGIPYGFHTDEAREAAREGFINHIHSNNKISRINQAVASKLKEDYSIETSFEKIIEGKWYDLEILNTNIVLEINPTYTHSNLPNHWSLEGLSANYHVEKSKIAEKNGYRCIHLFEWDNLDKIANLLKQRKVVYARQCKLVKLPVSDAGKFVDKYHIQGNAKGAKHAYGLILPNGTLGSVMTFSKPRYNKNYEWELLRLCTFPGIEIVGGPSRMFKKFIKEVNPESIISYCDKAKFTGKVYEKIGMKLDHTSSPARIWSKGSQYITDNLLRQRGYDQLFNTNYGKGTSNEQLMIQNGWRSVYDCGQMVFVWKKDN